MVKIKNITNKKLDEYEKLSKIEILVRGVLDGFKIEKKEEFVSIKKMGSGKKLPFGYITVNGNIYLFEQMFYSKVKEIAKMYEKTFKEEVTIITDYSEYRK